MFNSILAKVFKEGLLKQIMIIEIFLGIVILIILGVYIFFEIGINKLNKELEQKILHEKNRLAPMSFINGRIQKAEEECRPKIRRLKWKRNFLLGLSTITGVFLSIFSLF